MFCDEQVPAVATRLKGDETAALFAGTVTVTAAAAGIAVAASNGARREKFLTIFI
jgi:hypothetical protein